MWDCRLCMTVFVCMFCCVTILSRIIEFFLFRNDNQIYANAKLYLLASTLNPQRFTRCGYHGRIVYKLSVKHVKFENPDTFLENLSTEQLFMTAHA